MSYSSPKGNSMHPIAHSAHDTEAIKKKDDTQHRIKTDFQSIKYYHCEPDGV